MDDETILQACEAVKAIVKRVPYIRSDFKTISISILKKLAELENFSKYNVKITYPKYSNKAILSGLESDIKMVRKKLQDLIEQNVKESFLSICKEDIPYLFNVSLKEIENNLGVSIKLPSQGNLKVKKVQILYTTQFQNTQIEILHGNILLIKDVDIIVSPTDEFLDISGGVAKAISSQGGDLIGIQCKKYLLKNSKLITGSAMETCAGFLNYSHIIHTVGPVYIPNNDASHKMLQNAVISCLKICEELRCTSIVIPTISGGLSGYPPDLAAKVVF